jgi:cell wall-associated NlpC family hydrolase
MTRTRTGIVRLLVAVIVALPTLLSVLSFSSFAAPSAEEVESAKEKLARLEHEFEALAEQYNDAKYRLSLTEQQLAQAESQRRKAEARAQAAEERLAERAVQAYVGTGSQVDGLLGADSIAEFSDRLEFMGAVAESDAGIGLEARNARQEADWAAERYGEVMTEREKQVEAIESQLGRLDSMIAEQGELYEQLHQDRQEYLDYLAAQRAALQQAQEEAEQQDAPSEPPSDGGGYVPPANAAAGQIAVDAALSQLGANYVWGSADPNVGFDCSGLTSWAWAQAGVYIPHSSQAQHSTLPNVPLDRLAPGDLVFYYSPTSHVAMYIGGGRIVHIRNPSPSGVVQTDTVFGYSTPVGASRPG